MKANVLYGIGDLQVRDIPIPVLKKNEVLIRVKACGICGSDINRVFLTGTYHFPTVIGHEFSGNVEDSNGDNNLQGKRVGIFPLKPCFKCEACKEGKFEMCSNYDYLGSRCDGGFEEFVAVPKWNIIEIPDSISFEEAAMLEPISVAIHALDKAGNIEGKNVAIVGPGTIGNILIQVAKLKGAKDVVIFGRTQEKLDFSKNLGADYIVNTGIDESLKSFEQQYGSNPVDVFIEGTGASNSLEICIKYIKPEGEIILLGNPIGDVKLSKTSYWQILRRQIVLKGTWNSSFGDRYNDWKKAIQYLSSGKLDVNPLITHKLNFESLLEGLSIMRSPEIFSQKVMLLNYAD